MTPSVTQTAVWPSAVASKTPERVSGTTFYVSLLGNNKTGLSWEEAWNELDQIDWKEIKPGDLIWLDGGAEKMIYRTTLTPAASGEAGNPIYIEVAKEAGRNGQVIISGGREQPLPYCFESAYEPFDERPLRDGILLSDVSWIVIDGRDWRGILIENSGIHGIELKPDSSNITLRHLEITNVGFAKQAEAGWYPNGTGITLNGNHHLIERLVIHDNGHDAIQSNGEMLENLTIRQSWLYNSLPHPEVSDQAFNYCTHTDALQIYSGGVVENITISDSILGPGFTNTVLLGDKAVNVNHVLFENVLFLKGAENNVNAHSLATLDVKHWTLKNVTVYGPNTLYNGLLYKGENLTITDSIFVGSHINIPNTEPNISGNCQWQTSGVLIGEEIDPGFETAAPDPFTIEHYEPLATPCVGKGSSIFSPAILFDLPE